MPEDGEILGRALALLRGLSRDRAAPEEALERLHALEEACPGVPMDLVWDREAYEPAFSYDLILELGDGGSVSISHNPDRGLPWPLRGVQRASELGLVRVNGELLTVDRAIVHLDFLWDEVRLADRLLDACIIQAELQRHPVPLHREEIPDAVDAFRRKRRLFSADATRQWLREHGMASTDLERIVAEALAVDRLMDRVAEGRVEAHFAFLGAELDVATVVRFSFDTEDRARRFAAENAAASPEAFFKAATAAFLEGTGSSLRLESLSRSDPEQRLAEAVFRMPPGGMTDPVQLDGRFVIALVLGFAPATLDAATRSRIRARLFSEWLSERRRHAAVEWYWGRAARTPTVDPEAGVHPARTAPSRAEASRQVIHPRESRAVK